MNKKKRKLKKITIFMLVIFFIYISVILNKNNLLNTNNIKSGVEYILNKKLFSKFILNKDCDNINNDIFNNKQLIEANNRIKDLESMIDIKDKFTDKKIIHANIISRNIGYWFDNLIIDKGLEDGITIGDTVVNNDGLIGYISDINNKTSNVKILTSNTIEKISVKIESEDSYSYGLISNYNKKDNYFVIDGISSNNTIKENSYVLTSGFGINLIPGIIIGYVSDIEYDNYNLLCTLHVKPSVNYNEIRYVTIIGSNL